MLHCRALRHPSGFVNGIPSDPRLFAARHRQRLARELRALIALAAPILGAQIAQTGMGFVDTVMAGRVSSTDLAAVAIGSSLWVPLYLFVSGVILGTTPYVAQLHGAGRDREIGPVVQQSIWLALAIGLLGFLILRSLEPLLRFMDIAPPVRDKVLLYLDGVSWGFPAIAVFQTLRSFSEGLSLTRPVMFISFAALLLNIPLNYVLIYGKLGLPALGGAGCGWATGIIMWFMFLVFFTYLRRSDPAHPYRRTGLFGGLDRPRRAPAGCRA